MTNLNRDEIEEIVFNIQTTYKFAGQSFLLKEIAALEAAITSAIRTVKKHKIRIITLKKMIKQLDKEQR